MADSSVELNLGTGGDLLDAELLAGGTKRERMQVAGALLAEVARVKNTVALYNDYALAVREAPRYNEAGRYRFTSQLRVIPATADNATSTAFFWLQNPVGNTKNALVSQVRICQTTVAQAAVTDITANPLLAYARFTFTGTASGAQITPMKQKSADAANSATVRTAVTGMTVTLGALGFAQPTPVIDFQTSGVVYALWISDFVPTSEEGFLAELAPGEGLVFYSSTAGNGTARVAMGQGRWLEYTP